MSVGAILWRLPVRLTHWGVAAAVLFDLFNESGPVHRAVGYGAVFLVLLRLAYGAGRPAGDPAALTWPGPGAIRAHLRELRHGHVTPAAGHNPLGQWAVYLMWALVLGLGVSGWMSRLDAFWGDDDVIAVHEALADGLLACVGAHLLAVAIMSRLQGESLLRAMLTGRRRG